MSIIFMPNHMICQRRQFVNIHSNIIHYQTRNSYCDVVTNVHVLILLTKKQMISIMTQPLQLIFTFII